MFPFAQIDVYSRALTFAAERHDVADMLDIAAPHVKDSAHVLAEHAYLQLTRSALSACIVILDTFFADIAGRKLDFAENIRHHNTFLSSLVILCTVYHVKF